MPPLNKKQFKTVLKESHLRTALVAVLRHLGLIGDVEPKDDVMIEMAMDLGSGKRSVADDTGRVWRFEDYLSKPDPRVDKDIPF